MLRKTRKKIRRVAFFGDGQAYQGQTHFELAKKTAKLLAQNGYVIVNGGGPGIMLASTLGAKEAKGGVEVSIVKRKNVPKNFEGSSLLNLKLADKIYDLSNYENRMDKLIEMADAYVIFKGGTGTLAEVGLVWSKAKFAFGNHKPLIFVGKEWEEVIPTLAREMKMEATEKEVYKLVETPEEVVRALARVES